MLLGVRDQAREGETKAVWEDCIVLIGRSKNVTAAFVFGAAPVKAW